MIFNEIIKFQFSYCPLVWMFHSRQINNMINKLHEKAQRIVLNGRINDVETLLPKSNEISCHHRNIQTLMIELNEIKNELAPPIVDSVVIKRNLTYNFENLQAIQWERKRTVFWSRTIKLPCTPTMNIFAGRN